jgi:hypothetical protein
MVMQEIKLGTRFRVEAKDGGIPVVGTTITLERGHGDCFRTTPVTSVATDSAGIALFDHVVPGDYQLCIRSPKLGPESIAELKVSRWAAKDKTVPTTVEGSNPVRVRSASGRVRGPEFYPSLTQAPYSIDLFEAGTNAKVASTKTGANAEYSFGQVVAPGRYWLQITGGPDQAVDTEGKVLIEVKPDATDATVDMDVTFSDCGMASRQREEQPALVISGSACGTVIDALGASIEGASASLIDDNEHAVTTVRTSREGAFKVYAPPAGKYQLVIQRMGFMPYARMITIHPENDDACKNPIRVTLVL